MNWWLDELAAAADQRERRGLTRHLVTQPVGVGEPLLDLAGNDYLGLRRHPQVVEGAVVAARAYGAGAGASRLVTGTLRVHDELEAALAATMEVESALVFSTGYQANLGALTALADGQTLVVSDAHAHASLIDAARLSRASVAVSPHNDLDAVERLLRDRTQRRAVVVVESVYSVLGDAAPLAELATLTQHYSALLLVDEAHALGIVGDHGQGMAAATGISRLPHVVLTVTLSKSLGAQGGAVLGHPYVREHLLNTARPFIYDTGLAPPAAGAALAALHVLEDHPDLATLVRDNAALLAETCGVDKPVGAVLSVPMAGPRQALAAVEACEAAGVRIGCFRPPSTPDGSSRLRLTAHADHTAAQLDAAAPVLRKVAVGTPHTERERAVSG